MTLVACPRCGTQVTAGESRCPFCGTATPGGVTGGVRYAHQWEAVLERLRRLTAPKYRVKSILGYGGMAGVYLAEEPRLGRNVAIKVMSPALMTDPSLIDRFGQEARTIAQLAHPNIITIYEVDEREDLQYFVMTHVSGRSLGQVMAEAAAPLPIPVVRAWLYQIGDALGYAHGAGIVHRDVKPSNVLLDARGNAVVTDFGIAKVADEPSLTKTGMLVGSPEYMSPEQCSSGRVTGASDQYSLGVVAFQMVTGQPPFRGATLAVLQAHLTQQPPSIRDLRPDCPDDLVGSVSRMLQKQPEDRWPTLASALAAAGSGPPGTDDPVRRQMEALSAPAASISVREWPGNVREGARARVGADVFDVSDRRLTGRRVEWTSADELIATVAPDGTLLARSPGTTQVTASSGGASVTLPIEVEADLVPSVEVRPGQVRLGRGRFLQLEAVVNDFDGNRLDGRAVLWSSQDAEIVRVSADGIAEGLRTGSVIITASTGQKSGTATVAVTETGGGGTLPGDRAIPGARTRPGSSRSPEPAGRETAARGARPPRAVVMAAAGGLVLAAVLFIALRGGAGDGVQPRQVALPQSTTVGAATGADPGGTPATGGETVVAAGQAAGTGGDTTTAPRPAEPDRTPAVRPANPAATGNTAPPVRTATGQGADPPEAAPVPAPATFRVSTRLPANAVVTLRDAQGVPRPLVNGAADVPAGTYFATVRAPGYEDGDEQIVLRAGETRTWSPQLVPVALPPAATPTVDRSADQAGVAGAARAFVTALDRRDAGRVVPLLPADVRDGWRTLLTSRAVSDFSATLQSLGDAQFRGDEATADLVIGVSFRNANQTQRQTLRYTGSFERDAAANGWRLTALRQTGS